MYKKNVSAETKQLLILILSYPQQGVNMISSSQCYSQTMEEYEHTADMLVKVARVENTDHADLMRLKQDVIVLGTRLRGPLFSHLQPGVNVFSSLQCSGLTQAKERYEYITAMVFQVARVEITA